MSPVESTKNLNTYTTAPSTAHLSKKYSPQTKAIIALAAGIFAAGLGYAVYKNWDEIIPLFDFTYFSDFSNNQSTSIPNIPTYDSLPPDTLPFENGSHINDSSINETVATEIESKFFTDAWGAWISFLRYLNIKPPEDRPLSEPIVTILSIFIFIWGKSSPPSFDNFVQKIFQRYITGR